MPHLKNLHDELRRYMTAHRDALNADRPIERAELTRHRFIIHAAFRKTNELIEGMIAAMPMARMPVDTRSVTDEFRRRLQKLVAQYSAEIAAWPIERALGDLAGYHRATLVLHQAIDGHYRWEEERLAPLLAQSARLRLAPAIGPRPKISARDPSIGPSTRSLPHTIAASSSVSAPSDSRSGTPAAARGSRAAATR